MKLLWRFSRSSSNNNISLNDIGSDTYCTHGKLATNIYLPILKTNILKICGIKRRIKLKGGRAKGENNKSMRKCKFLGLCCGEKGSTSFMCISRDIILVVIDFGRSINSILKNIFINLIRKSLLDARLSHGVVEKKTFLLFACASESEFVVFSLFPFHLVKTR
ncbi:CLUMA_CG010803, isoform A [Clunio marinus]|uniref:CLUMA_CG010803, isoform A n=1 Tax=Clunio marinus TaxID=568069 RepID=A0A1J1IEI8_9DIPT|nr:CLUMA_CG010803, isoform A [Clunio marinus]